MGNRYENIVHNISTTNGPWKIKNDTNPGLIYKLILNYNEYHFFLFYCERLILINIILLILIIILNISDGYLSIRYQYIRSFIFVFLMCKSFHNRINSTYV